MILRATFCAVVLLALCSRTTNTFAQTPKLKDKPPEPGEILEVDDLGQTKVAKYLGPLGSNGAFVKVEYPDGRERHIALRNARRPKNKATAEKRFAAAAASTPSKGAAPAPGTAPPATASSGTTAGTAAAGTTGSGPKKKRIWSDKSGKFKIEASFVEITGGKLRLKKDDGSEVAVALEKLSEADQEIAQLMAAMRSGSAASDDENPFESVTATPGNAPPGTQRPETQGDYASAKKLTLEAPATWSLKPDTEVTPLADFLDAPLVLPKRPSDAAFFEGVVSLLLNSARGELWAAVKDGSPGGKGEMRLEVVEVATGEEVAMHPGFKAATLDDFSPSGNLLCNINNDDFHKARERVDVWNTQGKQLSHVLSLRPYKASFGPWGAKVVKARFVDDAHLLTMNDQAVAVLWEIATAKPLWCAELGHNAAAFDLSPSRKQLALYKENVCYVLDARTGKGLAKLPTPATVTAPVQLAFSLDGKQLALLAGPQLVVWDLTSGKPVVNESYFHMSAGAGSSLAWGADHNSLVVDNQWLIDLGRRLVLCQYKGGNDAVRVSDGQHWSVRSEFQQPAAKIHTILHATLPAQEVITKAASLEEEQLLAIKPGTKVSVQLALPFDGPTNDRIRQALFEKFKANGWTPVESGGDAVLDAKVTQGKPYEVEYRLFTGGSQKVMVTPLGGSMELKLGGKVIWQANGGWGPPAFLSLQAGQSITEATQVKASPEFFSGTAIPQRIFAYPKGDAAFHATIESGGVKVE
jgi:hypothetical protein